MGELRAWIEETTALFSNLERDAGPDAGDVAVPAILQASIKVSEVYVQLYGEGHIASILQGDANGRIRMLQELIASNPGRYGGSMKHMIEEEIAAQPNRDTSKLRTGSGTYEMLWTIRIFRFLVRMFDLLIEGKEIGQSARWTYGEVLAPYHGWILAGVSRLVLSLAPGRESLMAKNHVTPEETTALLRAVAEAVRPVATRLHRYYTDNGIDFQDTV